MITTIKRKARHTHTHTIRVISGLTHVYFIMFACFLNGKCRNPPHHNVCKPKRCPACTVICFLWIAGQCCRIKAINTICVLISICLLYTSRWIMAMQEYDFNIKYYKASDNKRADTLSRYPPCLLYTSRCV